TSAPAPSTTWSTGSAIRPTPPASAHPCTCWTIRNRSQQSLRPRSSAARMTLASARCLSALPQRGGTSAVHSGLSWRRPSRAGTNGPRGRAESVVVGGVAAALQERGDREGGGAEGHRVRPELAQLDGRLGQRVAQGV